MDELELGTNDVGSVTPGGRVYVPLPMPYKNNERQKCKYMWVVPSVHVPLNDEAGGKCMEFDGLSMIFIIIKFNTCLMGLTSTYKICPQLMIAY